MNPDLLDLDLPVGVFPDLPDEVCSVEENERWHQENHRLRLLRGDTAMGPPPAEVPFVIEGDWP